MSTKKNWYSKRRVVIFLLSVLVAVYWFVAKDTSTYSSKIPGAVIEVLWLPMIILLFALPLASIGLWAKDKFNPRSIYLYAFLVGIATVVWIFFLRD
jgi:hypothetical protein